MSDLSTGGPTREAATDVFLRELPTIAEHGAALIFDDFHVVDESPEVRQIVRDLVLRAPERLAVIFASRRAPSIPLARMRASGEVAEIGTDELRFDTSETARLFTETYGRELDPDVLVDVAARTEGWAASLQLVQAALRDRSPAEIRRFVRSLSGADHELYDYLAEEVVGDLPDDLQQFLMRTSILQVVAADLAAVVTGLDPAEVARLGAAAERLTLLTRPSRASRGPQRYHPLVREFLEGRLRSTLTNEAVAALHRSVANAARPDDWRVAAHHFGEAGDIGSVASTVAMAIPEIMGKGQHTAAVEQIARVPEELRPPVLSLVTSRIQLQRRDYEPAIRLSNAVLDSVLPGSQESDHALLNLVTLYLQSGRDQKSRLTADRLRETTSNEELRLIAEGVAFMIDATTTGSIDAMSRHLLSMADKQRGLHPHYYGVTMLNLAVNSSLQDEPEVALTYAREAIDALEGTSSRIELAAAFMALAYPLTLLGRIEHAHEAIASAVAADEAEANLDRAELADSYLDPDAAWSLLTALQNSREINARLSFTVHSAWYYARRNRVGEAQGVLDLAGPPEQVLIGYATARGVAAAYVAVASGASGGPQRAAEAGEAARRQGAIRWVRVAYLIETYSRSTPEFVDAIKAVGTTSPWNLTFVADLVARQLDKLDDSVLPTIQRAANLHPARWRFVLRERLASAQPGEGLASARLLEPIGERSDIPRLRAYARHQRRLPGSSTLGRSLARRLADKAYVEDLGRVSVVVGDRQVPGSAIRRRVLGLLCFLLTRPSMSSTRDQVLDALWPALDPVDALNSLNQTVYF
ncbi:MAG TPA: hypothetical protein VGO15_06610, partial [Candidatus Limnocylindrales bacterium]|nr:hypothetical protein [Candidatus Limnocylindrales bacterium]